MEIQVFKFIAVGLYKTLRPEAHAMHEIREAPV